MDPALASLFGALIGGGLASGSAYWLERMRAERDATAEHERETRAARRAGRLLGEGLGAARVVLARAVERDVYTWEPSRLLSTEAWREYRGDFAALASDEDWFAVAEAFAELDRLNRHLLDVLEEEHFTGVAERRHPMEPVSLGPAARRAVPDALRMIDAALMSLARQASAARRTESSDG